MMTMTNALNFQVQVKDISVNNSPAPFYSTNYPYNGE